MAVLVQAEMFQKGKVGLLIELSENMDIANHLVTLAVGHYLKLFCHCYSFDSYLMSNPILVWLFLK